MVWWFCNKRPNQILVDTSMVKIFTNGMPAFHLSTIGAALKKIPSGNCEDVPEFQPGQDSY